MKILDWIVFVLLIIGGLNWGLVGAFDLDLVATLFGAGTAVSRIVYIAVGLSALYKLFRCCGNDHSSSSCCSK